MKNNSNQFTANIWEDYYYILQVHYRADPEIINSTYRRLSKKYHPDVNKSKAAEAMMKRINNAYAILSNPGKRAAYDIEWKRRHDANRNDRGDLGIFGGSPWGFGVQGSQRTPYAQNSQPNRTGWNGSGGRTNRQDVAQSLEQQHYERAAKQLDDYYRFIARGDLDSAYLCISQYDRKRIKKNDFVKWQIMVGQTIELRSVQISPYRKYIDKNMGRKVFSEAVEYTVRIGERDLTKDCFSEYMSTKSVVWDGDSWGVYLGYKSVKPFIDRYSQSCGAPVDIKSAVEYWMDYQSKHDQLTGLMNLSGFLDASAREVARSKRYGTTFTIAMVELVHKENGAAFGTGKGKTERFRNNSETGSQQEDDLERQVGRMLVEKLRSIDMVCRWKEKKMIALLAETDLESASRAVNRICGNFNRQMLSTNKKDDYYTIYVGVCSFDSKSIESTLKKCSSNLVLARKTGRLRAVTGVYTRLRQMRIFKNTASEQNRN